MRWKAGKTFEERRKARHDHWDVWRLWFAWHPVRTVCVGFDGPSVFIWLEKVWRRTDLKKQITTGTEGQWWEYKKIEGRLSE